MDDSDEDNDPANEHHAGKRITKSFAKLYARANLARQDPSTM